MAHVEEKTEKQAELRKLFCSLSEKDQEKALNILHLLAMVQDMDQHDTPPQKQSEHKA